MARSPDRVRCSGTPAAPGALACASIRSSRMRRLLPLLALGSLTLLASPAALAQRGLPAPPNPGVASAPLPATAYYEIATPAGRMVVRLFDDTPLHRDNFKRLVQRGFYDSTAFHRVMAGFMIQAGDPNTRDADPMNDGTGDPGYSVPAEMGRGHYHVRGALAAARQPDEINPERASSGSQFYVVHGTKATAGWMDEARYSIRQTTGDTAFTWPDDVTRRYYDEGGAPFLDGQYTVFGELVEGFDALDAIATAPTGRTRGEGSPFMDRPDARLWMVVRPLAGYTPPAPKPAASTPAGQ